MAMLPLYLLPLFAVPGASTLQLASIMQDYMVLPRAPERARIWGTASAYSKIQVVLGRCPGSAASQHEVVASASGDWLVELDPHSAGTGFSITVTGDGSAVVLVDVAFGDVWICAGQSNMVEPLKTSFGGEEALAASVDYTEVRYIEVQQGLSGEPQADSVPQRRWRHSHATTGAWFSAACYAFGSNLYDDLGRNVPIGLMAIMFSGKKIELFSSPEALADDTCGGTQPSEPRYMYPGDRFGMPSDLWNFMLNPILNIPVRGVIWSHGESEARPDADSESYACRLPAMIADWRVKFGQPYMAFIIAQLTANRFFNFAELREAQLMWSLLLPHTSYATTIDIGESNHENPQYVNYHTRRQLEAGRRLALAAQYVSYGVDYRGVGPEVTTVERLASGQVRVNYVPGTAHDLHSAGSAECEFLPPATCCNESPFEQTEGPVDDNSVWVRISNWQIDGETILLDGVSSTATALRFAWEGYPQCALYNGVGGPDDHTGIASAPFMQTIVAAPAPLPSTTTRMTTTAVTTPSTNGDPLPDWQCPWYSVLAPVAPAPAPPPQEGTCRVYVEGPNMPNGIPAGACSAWYGTRQQAMTLCDADPNCATLYDFVCDDRNWRYCDSSLMNVQFYPRFAGACSYVVHDIPCSDEQVVPTATVTTVSGTGTTTTATATSTTRTTGTATTTTLTETATTTTDTETATTTTDTETSTTDTATSTTVTETSATGTETSTTQLMVTATATTTPLAETATATTTPLAETATATTTPLTETATTTTDTETATTEPVVATATETTAATATGVPPRLEPAPTAAPTATTSATTATAAAATYTDGPAVSNSAVRCSDWYGPLSEAQARCDADTECLVLHDWMCDGHNWRYCSSSIGELQSINDDRGACTQVHNQRATEITVVDGPRVSNGAAAICGTWHGTLAEAMGKCVADSSCMVLHDYGCNGEGWRYCSTGVQNFDVGDAGACTKVLQRGGGSFVVRNYVTGPRVSNSGFQTYCGTWFGDEGPAKVKCNEDAYCTTLYDFNCDGTGWRTCSGSLQQFQDMGGGAGACTLVDDRLGTGPIYVPGARVSNGATSSCGAWWGPLEEARTRCSSDPSCAVLHDWQCDGHNWRICTMNITEMQASAGGDTNACTQVLQGGRRRLEKTRPFLRRV